MHNHRTDALSLVAGVVFLVIGLMATVGSLTLDNLDGQWLGPTLLGAAGVALVASVPFRREAADEAHEVTTSGDAWLAEAHEELDGLDPTID